MKIVSCKNVFLTRSGIGLKSLRLINETVHQYPGKKRHFWRYAVFQFFLKRRIKLKGNFFIIHNHWCPGYYHWITEALPRLLAVMDRIQGYTLVLPESFKGPVSESIEPMFRGNIYWIPQDRNLVVENLLVPENPPYSGHYERTTFLKLRAIYQQGLAEKNVSMQNNRRIYASRSKANRRKVVNDNEVIRALEKHGFIAVNFEDFSFWQQAALMVNAEILVSIHGAGLANILFMNENTWLIELQKEPAGQDEPADVLYRNFAETLGLKYNMIPCKPAGADASLYTSDIFVDLSELTSLLPLRPSED